MRCPHCGWPNVSSATTCSKCGCILETNDSANYPPGGIAATINEASLNADVRTAQVSDGPEETCPRCGYMLRPGTVHCPQCNCLIRGNEHSTFAGTADSSSQRRPTVMDASADAPQRRATVNPFLMEVQDTHSCSLEPISRANERSTPNSNKYEGEEIVLTRANTDPGNPSITSRQQAMLSYHDNQWFIEDRSEQHTTFVQVTGSVPLKDGDYVLLGNRLFVFHAD